MESILSNSEPEEQPIEKPSFQLKVETTEVNDKPEINDELSDEGSQIEE